MPLPRHLQKYVVEQHYENYTPVDQATWRYILRQLKSFLSKHAHPSYLEGLEKTGIQVERIPRISEISEKISQFGWQAIPVSGFIPPAAFMELQSLGYLPIASAMRSLEHLTYTPAPDIVHEAAGHAPILIQKEFAQYLKDYAQVAKKAIISKEDLDVYEAIRLLSDLKENPHSTEAQISEAQAHLEKTVANVSHVSEATELGRMNWWTAEYGLIGDIQDPKIFGAGLLSSVGESKWCLSDKVRKIPLSLDCIKTSYDITEPQPQLFVAQDFKQLSQVLHELSETMAYKTGGLSGLKKAVQSKTVNTVEFESGVQISGIVDEIMTAPHSDQIAYVKFTGPTQIAYQDQQLPGHDRSYHSEGFGMAVGKFSKNQDLLKFESGLEIKGQLKDTLEKDGKILIQTFTECTVSLNGRILFQPEWGNFDLALGEKVVSVYGGPADRKNYGEVDDFAALQVAPPQYSAKEKHLFENYQNLRDLREKNVTGSDLEKPLQVLLQDHQKQFSNDWLLWLEAYELAVARLPSNSPLKSFVDQNLSQLKAKDKSIASLIEDGLSLAGQKL